MRVLLTGASGFLGSYILKNLIELGIDVVVLGRNIPLGFKGEFVEFDICDDYDHLYLSSIKATHLIHLAWCTKHGEFWDSLENTRWVIATQNLVEGFCRYGGEKVVVAGSCAEYDLSTGYCEEGHTSLAPANIYGMAKNLARGVVSNICETHQVAWSWGRIFFTFGPGENRGRLFPSLMDVYTGKRNPFPVGLTSERDFLHAEDVARAFTRLLEPTPHHCYNICSGEPLRIDQVVRMIAACFGSDPAVFENISTSNRDVSRIVGDNRRLKELGWMPNFTLEDVLESGKSW